MVVAGDAPAAPVANEACEIEVELGDVRIVSVTARARRWIAGVKLIDVSLIECRACFVSSMTRPQPDRALRA
jgi:hypothetical protein